MKTTINFITYRLILFWLFMLITENNILYLIFFVKVIIICVSMTFKEAKIVSFDLKKLSYIEFLVALSKSKKDTEITIRLVGDNKIIVTVDVGQDELDIRKFEFPCDSISETVKATIFNDLVLDDSGKTQKVVDDKDKELASAEVEKYYAELREFVKKRELTNSSPNILTKVPKGRKTSVLAAKALIKAFTTKDAKRVVRGTENIPDGPVIYLSLHRDDLDNFIGIPEIKGPAAILHGATVKPILLKAQEVTGWIAVDKSDEVSRVNSRHDSCRVLMEGISIWVYPEGAHNLSPNKLWLPWSYTALEWARITGCPIVPVVRDYEYSSEKTLSGGLKASETYSFYGRPIEVKTTDLIADKAKEVEQQWFDMKMEAMQEKNVVSKSEKREESLQNAGINLFFNSNLSWGTRISGLGYYIKKRFSLLRKKSDVTNDGDAEVKSDKKNLRFPVGVRRSAKERTAEYVRVLEQQLLPGLKFAGLTRQDEDASLRGANEERYKRGDAFINAHPVDNRGNLVEPGIIVGSFDKDGNYIRPTKADVVILSKSCEEAFPNYYAQNAYRYTGLAKEGDKAVMAGHIDEIARENYEDKSDDSMDDVEEAVAYPKPSYIKYTRKRTK